MDFKGVVIVVITPSLFSTICYMWLYLGLLAAFFLSFYNLCKKLSVQNNAVIPVLWLTSLFGFLSIVPVYILSIVNPTLINTYGIVIPEIGMIDHLYIVVKSTTLSASWLLGFYALKHLPITIVSPIRASGPFFTVIGALLFFGESPTLIQWGGFFLIIFSMILYSNVGKKEGIIFKSNKWIYAVAVATLLGTASGLYDKFLIQYRGYNAPTVQMWCSVYVLIIVGIFLLLYWMPQRKKGTVFQWRWSIPLVGVLLTASDFFYFRALQDPDALVMLLSAIKRSQILITVLVGGVIFREKNKRKKLLPLMGVLAGVAMILYAA